MPRPSTPRPGRRPGRRPGSDGRAAVVAAATRAIVEHGIAGVTARGIARAAGVSLGTLTHHFPSLDGLLALALEEASDRFVVALRPAPSSPSSDVRSRLLALLAAAMPDRPAARDQWRLWLQYWSRAIYDRDLHATHHRLYERWRATLRATLADGVRARALTRADATALLDELVPLFDGLCLQLALGAPGWTPRRARALLARRIDAHLRE